MAQPPLSWFQRTRELTPGTGAYASLGVANTAGSGKTGEDIAVAGM
jgi:hypothetical protein